MLPILLYISKAFEYFLLITLSVEKKHFDSFHVSFILVSFNYTKMVRLPSLFLKVSLITY